MHKILYIKGKIESLVSDSLNN